MKILGIIIIFTINRCLSISGVKWDQKNKNFVSIFSVKEFKILQNEALEKSRSFENHNFNGDKIYFLFYNDKDIFEFNENENRITGICGDLWTLLAEYLNFTMILKRTNARSLGLKITPTENYTGLLGMVQNDKNLIIPAMEAFIPRLEVVDFSIPLWKTRHRIFIKANHQYKTTWMLDLFSLKIWILIVIFYLILSTISILAKHTIKIDLSLQHLISSGTDYFFYNFAALCNQGDVLYTVQKNFKIQSFCISMFSWLLITAFSSQLIIYVTRTVTIPPFDSLQSLINDTDYIILSEKYSIVYISFELNYRPIYPIIKRLHRIKFYTDYKTMWNLACSDLRNYAILQSEFVKIDNNVRCKLDAVGMAYIQTWVVAGLPKKFAYKKTIDISLMKLHEFGIISVLKARWLKVTTFEENLERYYAPITLDQISLLIRIYFFGLCTSIILVFIENIIYRRKIIAMKKLTKLQISNKNR